MKKIKLWITLGIMMTSITAMAACGSTRKDSTTDDGTKIESDDKTNDNSMGEDIKDAGSEVLDGAKDAVDGVVDGAEDITDGVSEEVEDAGDKAGNNNE